MGYKEVLKLCQDALALLSEAPSSRDQLAPGSSSTSSQGYLGLAGGQSSSQSVTGFLSETDEMISEATSLLRKYEAMRDAEDLDLELLAEGVRQFMSAVREKLNEG